MISQPSSLDSNTKKELLQIARCSLKENLGLLLNREESSLLNKGKTTPIFVENGGFFITLKTKNGRLRGCIGTLSEVKNLAQRAITGILESAFEDPRFPPVQKTELENLEIEMTVLSPLRPISDYREIEIGKHGVFLTKGYHRAVFLPQVAVEQGWSLEQLLQALCQKGGVPQESYLDSDCRFEVFEGVIFSETDLN